MLVALLNLPKWLLMVIAIGVFSGQFEQLECKLLGCDSNSVAQSASDDHHTSGDSSSPQADHHCTCQCHFGTMAVFESALLCDAPRLMREADMVEGSDHAPDSPCVDIEHPPQLA